MQSMDFSRPEYWPFPGWPFPSPGDLSKPGIEHRSPELLPDGFHQLPGGSEAKASASNVGDLDLIPGLGRSPGEGNGNPLQYSCLENPMEGGAW